MLQKKKKIKALCQELNKTLYKVPMVKSCANGFGEYDKIVAEHDSV